MSDNELCLQEIGKRITDRRKKLGLTQEALAEKGDVTTQFVSYAESGKRAMRPENLLKISSALEVSADYFLSSISTCKTILLCKFSKTFFSNFFPSFTYILPDL